MKGMGYPSLMIAIAMLAPIAARGQGEDRPATPIAVRPAAEPVPALAFRLVPPRHTLEPGNAALNYHRAIGMVLEARRGAATPGRPDAQTQAADWNALPLEGLPVAEAKRLLEPFANALAEVERGTRMVSCDWGLSGRPEGVQLLMPEIQESRSLSRLVTLRTRVAIREGELDEAWRWIGVGLVLGRHVAAGDNLVQGLVGVAVASQAIRCLEEFVQAPGAPNLYWALANRPRPLVDLRPALEGEMTMLDRELPDLARLDDGVWSVDQARRFADALQAKIGLFNGPSREGAAFERRLGVAAMALKLYPEAKAALIASGKRTPAEVEAMPVVQVAALHAYDTYRRLRDDRFKWLGLPYATSFGPLNQAVKPAPAEAFANPLLALFALLEPALNSARLAELRLERHLDALQAVEAIRLHLAANGGALPARLEDISIVPVPPDPITGRPFDYAKDGDAATLSAPVPPGVPPGTPWAIRYALQPAK
jgi:hypothetical protein